MYTIWSVWAYAYMPMLHLVLWLWGWYHGCMHLSELIRLDTLSCFMTSLSSTWFLILNSSQLAILIAQPFLCWQFPFSSCLFTCSMASNSQGRHFVQPRWLLPFVWQKHFKMSILIYFNALYGSPLWFLLPVMSLKLVMGHWSSSEQGVSKVDLLHWGVTQKLMQFSLNLVIKNPKTFTEEKLSRIL